MNFESDARLCVKGPSAAERAWREGLRQAGLNVAPNVIAVHPSQLNNPAVNKRVVERLYAEFVAAEPDNLMALDGLAFLLQHRGDWTGSLAVRRRRYEVESRQMGVADEQVGEVVAFLASSLGDGEAPAAAPPAYVASLFDRMAVSYDVDLLERLHYRGPMLLRSAVDAVLGAGVAARDVLDLGCGTGLAGAAFRPLAGRLTGIDLSEGMLDRARQRNIYDELQRAEIVAYLGATAVRYDVIVAADVLNYLGDLLPVFRAAANVLRAGGLLAVTVEAGDVGEFRLRGKRRYQHARAYLERTAAAAGLSACALEEVELRRELGEPVPAWCGVWRAGGAPG